jgi:hypothetical protein
MSLNTTAVRIKVTLEDVKPEVMRRLVVPVTLRLDRLHLTLQAAFGWTNSHLFEFFAGEVRWGIPDPHNDYGHQPMDASKARLCDVVRETGAKTIHYLYDFGDSWDHVIKLEKWFDNTTTEGLPPPARGSRSLSSGRRRRCAGLCRIPRSHRRPHPSRARTYAPLGPGAVRSQRRRSEGARSRRQRVVRHMETAATRHANKIGVKRHSMP